MSKEVQNLRAYTSPEMEVIETQVQTVICQSVGTPNFTNDDTPYNF